MMLHQGSASVRLHKQLGIGWRRGRIGSILAASVVGFACFHSEAFAATGYEEPIINPQIISTNVDPGFGYYSIINKITGAERFYLAGYFGNNTMIANVEAGHVWNGHETTGAINSYISNSPINTPDLQYDFHATMVGFTMVGLGPYPYYYYQFGMAPSAYLTSVAIATSFGPNGSFDINASTFVYGYKSVMQDSVYRDLIPGLSIDHRPVDVVNSSWGYEDNNGSQQGTMIIDALTYANHQTVCISTGNHGAEPALVAGPAVGFNCIAVGALGTDHSNPIYGGLADFSNAGPNDFYNPQTHQTITGVRAAVSICAPGTDLILAAYVGSTGANAGGNLFDLTGIDPSLYNQLYFTGAGGTSFSSPVVAGGAALVVDAGYANFGGGKAVDGRVVKAVLLNSANKPAGWTNNTVNVGGVLKTTQGLDWNFGAGALNLDKGYDQYLSGTTDVPGLTGGTVHNLGWDYGHASLGLLNDYFLENTLHQGDTLTATLTWFVNVFFNSSATADANDSFSDADLHNTYFDQMDLQVWLLNGGVPTTLIADSTSPYNNVDHLFFSIPQDGMYAVRVSWLGDTYDLTGSAPQGNDYALAWSAATPVPEPTTLVMILSPTMALLLRRSRKN